MTVEHVEVLVEEPSMEAALRILLPMMLGEVATFEVYPSNGKQDLLKHLPNRLQGYRAWLPENWRIVVVVDRDDEDCRTLKNSLDQIAHNVGLITKTSTGKAPWQIVNRLAIEELEAWFFGDMEAVRTVFPRVPDTIERKARFRDPDAIRDGTWQALEQVLQKAGYFRGGYQKLEAAREIAAHMTPQKNHSRSFQLFFNTILAFQDG